MPYGNYFPATYQPNYYGNMYQQIPYQQPMMQQQQAQAQQQQQNVQQNGFVRVQNEAEARSYPVAPGNSVTFINENAPYCYTKTMDVSQLDRPKFEKYRLVKEEPPESAKNGENGADGKSAQSTPEYALKSDLTKAQMDIDALRDALTALSEKKPKKRVVVEEEDDDE